MPTLALGTAAFVLAVAIPTSGGTTERSSNLLVMRAEEPVAPRPTRARDGAIPAIAIAIAPSQPGAALSLGGRF